MVNFKLEDILTSIANAKKFQDKNGYFPNYITVNGQKVQKKDFIDGLKRLGNYPIKKELLPQYVALTIQNTQQTTTKTSTKSAFHQLVEEHVGFKYTTWEQFFAGMGGKGYKYYNNDVYPQGQALDRLKANSGLNCSDISQIGYAVGGDLGLEMHYGHIKCKEGGHIVLIKGPLKNAVKEGRVWDLAKKISKTSPFVAGANDYWCKDTGKFVSFDDPWLISDDGN